MLMGLSVQQQAILAVHKWLSTSRDIVVVGATPEATAALAQEIEKVITRLMTIVLPPATDTKADTPPKPPA